MATNITLVAIAQMVDIALNCNEGVINFQVLHTLLHVMIQQLNLTDVALEFRGAESDNIQKIISTIKPGIQMYPQYSLVGTRDKKVKTSSTKKQQIKLGDIIKEQETLEEKKEKELRVIERRKDSKEDPVLHPLPLKSPPGSSLGITPADVQTVVVIESQSNLPQYTVAVSKSMFDDLLKDMTSIKTEIKELTDLPGNLGLLEATRSQSGPITEMFNILNLTKRMDATEIAVEKMGSLIEDVVKMDINPSLTDKLNEVKDALQPPTDSSRRSSLNQLDMRVTNLEIAVQELSTLGPLDRTMDGTDQGSATVVASSKVVDEKTDKESTLSEGAAVARSRKTGTKGGDTIKIFSPKAAYVPVMKDVDLSSLEIKEALALVQEEFQNLKVWMMDSIQEIDKALAFAPPTSEINSQVVESKFKEHAKQIEEMGTLYRNQITQLNEQFVNVQQDMNDIFTKLEVVLPGGDSTGVNAETTLDLAQKLSILEKEIVTIAEAAEKMRKEKAEQDKQTETIMEQLDVLKIVKANREDLEDALGDKADACVINRKVSHDQFDAACDDLSRGIEEALSKLEEQEEMWHQALDAIHREVGNKLDKDEVDPIREFVNNKLKALQEKFRTLAALKKEQEAAGTKSRFLRNVNCISCDKDVVMRREMDPSLKPPPYAMPPTRSMAPYLAYELDQLRKQQKCTPGSKNLNYIESALKGRTKEKDHICNRYCGGSHTVTTPQQRVTRLGHFLEQWGPEIAPLNEEYIRGKDNQMYRARDENLYKKTGGDTKRSESALQNTVVPIAAPGADDQLDQDNLVSKVVEEAIANDAQSKKEGESKGKKFANIGAVPNPGQSPNSPLDLTPSKPGKGSRVRVAESAQRRPSPSN